MRFHCSAVLLSAVSCACLAQSAPMPRLYPGVQTNVPGIFMTPVPNAPFTAKVEIISHSQQADGTDTIRTTTANVARNSSGVILNERHMLVPTTFKGDPPLLSSLIFDPRTRRSTILNPLTHIAREMTLQQPLRPEANSVPQGQAANNPYLKEEDLGTQTMDGLELKGTRRLRVVPAAISGTGTDLTITDEYWYSAELSIYVMIKHDDPRTGEQIVAVRDIQRAEPAQELFEVPKGYKEVDETPVRTTESSR